MSGDFGPTLLEVVGGGATAIVMLRLVLQFLRQRGDRNSQGNSAGDKPVDFWRLEMRQAVAEVLEPVMSTQSKLLEDINESQRETVKQLTTLVALEKGRRR